MKAKEEKDLAKAIEKDFASKLIDYKTKQSGHEFRLFGHTMVSYDQLKVHVKHNQCVKITAKHKFHTESSEKWLCKHNLDDFWESSCINMDPNIELCDEKGISLFLGKCVESDSFEVCPSDPIVVEHLKDEEEEEVPHGCFRDVNSKITCPKDMRDAFKHGSCFKVAQKFVCEEDMDKIMGSFCVDVERYNICNQDLIDLFKGDPISMNDGRSFIAEFPKGKHGKRFSGLCRHHEGLDICLENIVDLYKQPHDCVMYADEWICQDDMIHAWKEGCIVVDDNTICGPTAIEVVLQMCVDIQDEWICPTAVGTKHAGYTALL